MVKIRMGPVPVKKMPAFAAYLLSFKNICFKILKKRKLHPTASDDVNKWIRPEDAFD